MDGNDFQYILCVHRLVYLVEGKTNFFEKRVGEYQKASVMDSTDGEASTWIFRTDAAF